MRRKKNIILEKVLVEDYAAEGRSIARVDGKVVFIEDAVPGDIVDVRLQKNKKDWAEGLPIHFYKYSPERVTPFCEHFGVCGGCQWQMLPYEKQLAFKQKQVEETLKRIGKLKLPPLQPIIGAERTTHYRNKIEYTFGSKRFLLAEELKNPGISADENVAGYHAEGIFDKVVDIRTCYLQQEPTNRLRLAVKQFALENGFSFYNIKNHNGFLRTMQIRICRTGEIMVNLVFGYDDKKQVDALLNFLMRTFPEVTTLLYTINPKMNDSLSDLLPRIYKGKGYVIEMLEDFAFRIGPKSFFQTNTYQAEKLYQVTRDFAELSGEEVVYDLYCGTGSIGLFLSKNAKKVIGIESIGEAVDDAIENAVLNNVRHARFIKGDVVNVGEVLMTEDKPDVIITDPPRSGMHEKLVEKILDMNSPVVVYVSCNPATQARDVHLLAKKYEVTRIQPVDMFPHTHHIENVLQLKLLS